MINTTRRDGGVGACLTRYSVHTAILRISYERVCNLVISFQHFTATTARYYEGKGSKEVCVCANGYVPHQGSDAQDVAVS